MKASKVSALPANDWERSSARVIASIEKWIGDTDAWQDLCSRIGRRRDGKPAMIIHEISKG